MADAPIVLCDALCFIANKYGKTDVKTLNSALFDFYSVDVLSAAKKRLLDDVDKLNLKAKRPHVPSRRDGDGRLLKEVDDLLLLVAYVDEQKALDKLPKYVAGSPDNMPSLRLYEGDLSAIMTLLHSMSGRFEEFRSALAAITHDVHALQRAVPPEPARARAPAINTMSTTTDCNVYNRAQGGLFVDPLEFPTLSSSTTGETADRRTTTAQPSSADFATMASAAASMSTPFVHRNRYGVLASTDDDADHSDAATRHRDQQFVTVQSRRSKRRREHSGPRSTVNQTTTNPVNWSTTRTSSSAYRLRKIRSRRYESFCCQSN